MKFSSFHSILQFLRVSNSQAIASVSPKAKICVAFEYIEHFTDDFRDPSKFQMCTHVLRNPILHIQNTRVDCTICKARTNKKLKLPRNTKENKTTIYENGQNI